MRNICIAAVALASVGLCSAAPSPPGGSCPKPPPGHHGHHGHQVCPVKCEGSGQDDSKNILEALHKCNNGGRVVFEKSNEYTIGTALDLTFLNNIDIGQLPRYSYTATMGSWTNKKLEIAGEIIFGDDTEYWQKNSFKFVFQNSSSFWLLGGHDVSIYGMSPGARFRRVIF